MIGEVKYSKTLHKDFSETLNQRVMAHFEKEGINPFAQKDMLLKTFLLLVLYAGVYSVIISGSIRNLPVLFILWGLLGLGQSFIGMCVMHDAVHGAYTKNRLSYLLLQLPIIAIGVESKIWRIEHNILHHTYPNVDGVDQDIHPRFVFRFSVHQPRRWYHRYQHIYATFFYSFLIIEWLTVKDFLKVIRYHHLRFFKSYTESLYVAAIILLKKLAFYFLFLYLPLQLMTYEPWIILCMFLTMLVVAGIVMTIIFQLAHVVPDCETEAGTSGMADKSWHVYQLESTCNFAHADKLLSYLIGGLNYQVEHHLFPKICHVHYPAISPIVKQTAEEFGHPYHYRKTFSDAVKAHYRHLKELGQGES